MTQGFTVRTTASFDRLARTLRKQHKEFTTQYEKALAILGSDPVNRSRVHSIKKLANVSIGAGQYRLRLGRWRFRYDIEGKEVILYYCGLRRENTYR